MNYLGTYTTSGGYIISSQETARDLGVELSAQSGDYKWTPHINKMGCGARETSSWVLGVFKVQRPLKASDASTLQITC